MLAPAYLGQSAITRTGPLGTPVFEVNLIRLMTGVHSKEFPPDRRIYLYSGAGEALR